MKFTSYSSKNNLEVVLEESVNVNQRRTIWKKRSGKDLRTKSEEQKFGKVLGKSTEIKTRNGILKTFLGRVYKNREESILD